MRKIITLLAFALAGCGTPQPTEPTIVTHDVNMPVSVACVPDNLGEIPNYVDADAALKSAPDAAARYQLLGVGRGQRIARLNELEIVIEGCRKSATSKPE
jgi:hypothetical protein